MKWSWKIGRLAGIDVFVHFTFFLLLAWVGLGNFFSESFDAALHQVAFMMMLFGIVVLHELGHALAARRYGIATRDITLLPIGGVARLERMPDEPRQELVVAIAGPAVNVVLAALFFGLATVLGDFHTVGSMEAAIQGSLPVRLFWANIVLIVFNLLPAFPMDGGRVLRALLSMRLGRGRATHIAARIGQGMAALFAVLGLLSGNPLLCIVGLFVWMGAAQENRMTQMKDMLAGISVGQAMITEFDALRPYDPLVKAVDATLSSFQQDFPVVDSRSRMPSEIEAYALPRQIASGLRVHRDDQPDFDETDEVVGVLTRDRLMQALAEGRHDLLIGDIMDRKFVLASPEETIESVYDRIEDTDCPALPVLENGVLIGMLTRDTILEHILLRSARKSAAKGGRTRPFGFASGSQQSPGIRHPGVLRRPAADHR